STYLTSANFFTGLDPYFLYYSCYLNPEDAPIPTQVSTTILRTYLRRMKNTAKVFRDFEIQPACAHYNDSTVYLQRQDVRDALHILAPAPPYESCNEQIADQYDFGDKHLVDQQENVRNVVNTNKT
ncbi:hypothetical protein NECAME_08396, partial [Necator americanus]